MNALQRQDLTARLMGPLSLMTADGREALPKGKKPRGVLAFLLFNHGKPISRAKVVDLFWPDREAEQGQASLRQALHEIRRCFEEVGLDRLEATRDILRISSSRTSFDLWTRDGKIVTGLTEPFLDGLDPLSEVFDEWVAETRRVIVATQLNQAERDLSDAERGDDPEKVAELAQIVLMHDPANEPASRSLLTALGALGKMSAVKQEFDRLERTLSEDGFEVSEATVELYDRLRRTSAQGGPVRTREVERTSQVPVLAIVPSAQDNASAQDAMLADALAEECAERLANLPELRTIDTLAFPGGEMPQNADWDYVLRCRIRTLGAVRQCSLRLADARSDLVCWTMRETLDGERFSEQLSSLADRCVAGLISAVERTEMDRVTHKDEADLTAYDHYLRAKFRFFQAEGSGYSNTVQNELELAIEKDPLFVPAYAHLIQSYNTGYFLTRPGLSSGPGRERALALADKLLAIDSHHANSHIAMGWCQLWKRNFAAAERSIDKAIGIGAYEAHRLNAIGTALVYLGRHEEGERFYDQSQARMAHELDYLRTDYGELCYFLRDYDRALSWLDFGERRIAYRTQFWRALVMAQLGRLPEAREDIEALAESVAKNWAGPKPCTVDSALGWFVEMIPLRRKVDQDQLLDGLGKAGYSFPQP